ncbi:MAG: spore coat protein CotJB [Ruminococcaceae bacterium]|jgi:spore coat protein JB|nr:spore coat protein CotJB [Oscillospiraceae bacterium]
MSEQEQLMRRTNACRFATWELPVFTHPGDCKAAKQQKKYRRMADDLTIQYKAAYGPMNQNSSDTSRWHGINAPWPWDVNKGGNK